MATKKRSIKRNYIKRKTLYPVYQRRRLGEVANASTPKKNNKSTIVIIIIVILLALVWWKKDWIINLFRKKTVVVTETEPTNTVIKYVNTKTEDFPLQKGSNNNYVKQVQMAYNSIPTALIPNKTKLVVDGNWGASMDAEFKKHGIPLVITKELYDKGLQALIK